MIPAGVSAIRRKNSARLALTIAPGLHEPGMLVSVRLFLFLLRRLFQCSKPGLDLCEAGFDKHNCDHQRLGITLLPGAWAALGLLRTRAAFLLGAWAALLFRTRAAFLLGAWAAFLLRTRAAFLLGAWAAFLLGAWTALGLLGAWAAFFLRTRATFLLGAWTALGLFGTWATSHGSCFFNRHLDTPNVKHFWFLSLPAFSVNIY